ncbi:hypothetical protein CXB51_024532 [Gossypium anomalum]|uniref:Uncharacterized protein n=1 Tax=Gossypium anomalum TaxID=47600 RepID=A0A8J5YBG4_9ROSI|nr:hypothetical protein CXB51_024532 [Gossypium anomalum]
MQRRSNRPLPLPMASLAREDNHSPLKSTIFNKRKRTIAANASHSTSVFAFFNLQSSQANHKTLTTFSNLKEFASSRLEDIKRNLINRSHYEILKDLDASHSRLQSASRELSLFLADPSRHRHANKRLRKLKRNTIGYWKRLKKAMNHESFICRIHGRYTSHCFPCFYCLAEFPDLSKINRNLTKEFIKDHLETDYVLVAFKSVKSVDPSSSFTYANRIFITPHIFYILVKFSSSYCPFVLLSVCKASIFELSKSFEKRIDNLRNQFGMPFHMFWRFL